MLNYYQIPYLGDEKKWCIDITPFFMKLWGDDIIQSAVFCPGTTRTHSKLDIEYMAKAFDENFSSGRYYHKTIEHDEEIIITFINGKKMYIDSDYNGATLYG